MRLFVTGDTHGDIDFHKLNTKNFPEGRLLTKEDFVIICGDFGAVWDGAKSDKYLQKWYNEKPWTTLFIDGNHENHDLLNSYPVSDWNGGKVHFITPSIIHLMRGQVYKIGDKTFFTMGGAESHDKIYRKEGVSWWRREMPSNDEYEEGLTNLNKVNNQVDYILSHCAPDRLQSKIAYWYEHDKLTNYLKIIRQIIEFGWHYFGHYHIDKDFLNYKATCLYNNIIELGA
mgnify:FL=1